MNIPIMLIRDPETGKYNAVPALQGAPGISIDSVDINEDNHLIVILTDGTTKDAGELPSGGGGAVLSVNGKTGNVELSAADVGADPAGTAALLIGALKIPSALKDLTDDADHRTVTDTEKTAWNGKEEAGTAQKLVDGLDIPAKTSDLENDSGFITAQDVPAAPVTSVNSKTGAVNLTYADVGADQVGAAGTAVSEHNVDENAHNDIRLLLSQFMTNVNNILNSTDEDLDQMSEIVAYIKSNKGLIEAITTEKISYSDIVNNLTTNVSNKPLSAAQGVALKALIDGIKIPTNVSEFTNDAGYLKKTELPDIPDALSDLTQDSTHRVVTDAEKAAWNGKENAGTAQKLVDALGIQSIPDYVVSEAEATLAKAASHGILGRTIRFIAISDTHEDSEEGYNAQITVSNLHAGQAIAYLADRIGLDFIAHCGDVSSAGSFLTTYQFATLRKDIENVNSFLSPASKGTADVRLVGNHDQFYTTDGKRLFNSGAYDYFGRFCEGHKDTVGGYGYFDIDSAKVRVIYLNTSDVPSSTTAGTLLAITTAQKNWLCETLIDTNEKDDAAEWKILLLSHAPLDFGAVNISTDILLPYTNGGSYGGYTFTNHDAQIISNVHGHVHCYSYGYIGEKIRRFTIPNACFVGNNHYGSREGYESWVDSVTYNKTAGTGEDTAFSLVTIDLDSGTCYVDNYGAGIDREFSTDYASSEEPAALLNLDREYVAGTTGNSITTALDESKAYLNVAVFLDATFNDAACTASNITENSVTVTESGSGGITIAYPVHLNISAKQKIRITADYSGAGKCRVYARYIQADGAMSAAITAFVDEASGASGTMDVTLDPNASVTDVAWFVLMLGSNTGSTKTFENVLLEII